jgi:WD40 repeat protein
VPVWAGDFLSNRRTLLTGGVDRTIRRWDAENRSAANPPEAEVEGPPVFGSE